MDVTAVQVIHANRIELTGQKVNVPNNDYALLSYYLNSVSSCINNMLDANLTNYNNYTSFTQDTKNRILLFSFVLNPAFMTENGIFVQMESLPNNRNNQFVKVTEEFRLQGVNLQKDGVSVMDAESIKVSQQMLYKEIWAKNNYFLPLARLLDKKEPSKSIDIESGTGRQMPSQNQPNNNSGNGGFEFVYVWLFFLCLVFNLFGVCCFSGCSDRKTKSKPKCWAIFFGFICNCIILVILYFALIAK